MIDARCSTVNPTSSTCKVDDSGWWLDYDLTTLRPRGGLHTVYTVHNTLDDMMTDATTLRTKIQSKVLPVERGTTVPMADIGTYVWLQFFRVPALYACVVCGTRYTYF